MRKNIVVSMLVIALAAALLGGATFAWFTDQKEVAATFTAGTIVLGDPGTDFTIADIAPGWGVDDDETWAITIKNDGTLDMYYRLTFTATSGTLGNVLEVSLDGANWTTGLANFTHVGVTALSAAASDSLTLYFRLPTTVGNAYQGASFSGTLVVEATQADYQDPANIDWTVTP